MRPGGHKKGHSQIGESAHAHPLPLGGVIAIRRTLPKIFRRTFRKVPTQSDQAHRRPGRAIAGTPRSKEAGDSGPSLSGIIRAV